YWIDCQLSLLKPYLNCQCQGCSYYHFGFIKYRAVPSGSLKCKNWPPSSSLVVTGIDNLFKIVFASSKLSVVKPIEILPDPDMLLSSVGCSPITIPGAVSWA